MACEKKKGGWVEKGGEGSPYSAGEKEKTQEILADWQA